MKVGDNSKDLILNVSGNEKSILNQIKKKELDQSIIAAPKSTQFPAKTYKSKKKIILIISISAVFILLLIAAVLLMGHFIFDWFKKSKELVVARTEK